MDMDQVDMMNKLQRLEKDLAGKEKEYRLLSIRVKDNNGGGGYKRRRSIGNVSRGGEGSSTRLVKSANKYRS